MASVDDANQETVYIRLESRRRLTVAAANHVIFALCGLVVVDSGMLATASNAVIITV